MVHDYYRPLGVGEQRRARRRSKKLAGRLVVAACVATVCAGSVATAVVQPGFPAFRVPQWALVGPLAARSVETASVAPIEPVAALPVPDPAPTPAVPRPNIIRMNEDGGVTVVEVQPFEIDPAYTGSIRVLEPGSLRQAERLAHIPDEALLESTAFGLLPKRADDGRRPLDVYAGASSGARGTRIALVVGGLGISQTGTQAALATLPRDVTLAFAASGNSLDRWMQTARRSGHELLLQAPMEPCGYPGVSPGPHTLTVDEAAAGDLSELHRAMSRLSNYVGIANFMGARLTADTSALEPVLTEISRRGLLFVDDGSSARSKVRDIALASQVPFAVADRTVDGDRDPAAIRAELDILERSARASGSAIGFASAFDTTVRTIAEWTREAEQRGIEIVPISALAFDPEAQ